MPGRNLTRQLAAPTGFFAQMAGRYRSRVNAPLHAAALAALEAAPGERVLEAGFGHGSLLEPLAGRVAPGSVTGVEASDALIERASRRYRPLLERGLLELRRGTPERLPFADRRFDRACSIDGIQAWRSPEAGLVEIRRVLRPGGRLVLAFYPWDALRRRRQAPSTPVPLYARNVGRLLESAGFREVRVQLHGPETWPFACAIAERAPG
ncbi:MAG TPA: methyltransferase domain-containing protein [Gammaproteobacteria bacterium]|nr:methyltransferase domain-containing protein [Gammaproteobacteria bacterium]